MDLRALSISLPLSLPLSLYERVEALQAEHTRRVSICTFVRVSICTFVPLLLTLRARGGTAGCAHVSFCTFVLVKQVNWLR